MRNKKLIVIFSVLCGLTLLIILNSVIFSIRYVNAYCYNFDNSEIEKSVLENSGIKTGKSIFLLDEQEVIKSVEENVLSVRVINVERKFPNRVYINYIEVKRCLKYTVNDTVYYLSSLGEVVEIVSKDEANNDGMIELRLNGSFVEVGTDRKIKTDDPMDAEKLDAVLTAFASLLRGELIQLFDYIDFTKNFIYMKTCTGVMWELQDIENSKEKLRLALSVYVNYGSTAEEWKKGTLIISGGETIAVSYTKNDRYTNGVG